MNSARKTWTTRKSATPIDRYVGSRVRMRRLLVGMTQEALGEKAGGITFRQVQKYEKGTNRIGASRLHLIAEILNVPVAFFFEGAPRTGDHGAVDTSGIDATKFLQTTDAVELMRAFVGIKDKGVRREFIRLAQELARSPDNVEPRKSAPRATAHGPEDAPRSREEQAAIGRKLLFEDAKRALFHAWPPAPKDVRVALRKLRRLGWEPQDSGQRKTREALMGACQDYIRSNRTEADVVHLNHVWDSFSQVWTFDNGQMKKPLPETMTPDD
jgi:transcriptional regulator with XRE-family HTH domain